MKKLINKIIKTPIEQWLVDKFKKIKKILAQIRIILAR